MKKLAEKTKQRVYECIDFITNSSVSWTQYSEFATEEYGISSRQAHRIWMYAWEKINSIYNDDEVKELTQQGVMKLDKLYAAAKESGTSGWNTLNNILRERAKLLGLYETKISVKGDVKIQFDFDNAEEDMVDEN